MRKLLPASILAALLLTLSLSVASAHQVAPQHNATCTAGAYQLEVNFYAWPLRAEQPSDVLLTPQNSRYQQRELGVSAMMLPKAGTPGYRQVEKIIPDNDSYGGYATTVRPSVRGEWQLAITVRGPQGDGTCLLDAAVEGPAAIPYWLGWLIALGPTMSGIAWFGWWQHRRICTTM